MIDGIKLQATFTDFEGWKQANGFRFVVSTETETGEIRAKRRREGNTLTATITHRANFETYQLTVKELTETGPGNSSTRFVLIVDGSLHKNHQQGSNYKPFTFADLQAEIKHLCSSLKIAPECLKINRLEVGQNIPFTSPVFPFLKSSLLTYKGHCFSQYRPGRDGKVLGYECNGLTQYRVKIYDKALQFDLPFPLMRFELRFLKMEPLKGIKTLADLSDFNRVNGLFNLLIKAWGHVLLFDRTIEPCKLTASQKEFWRDADNPKYWEGLNNGQYREQKKRFQRIIEKHGIGHHEFIKNGLSEIWAQTCKNPPELTGWQPNGNGKFSPGIDHVAKCPKNQNPPELTINIKGQKRGTPEISCSVVDGSNYPVIRKCVICGKDISERRKNATTCSRVCRNAKSNPGNNFKRKLGRLQGLGLLFDLTQYMEPVKDLKENNIKKH